MTITTKAIKVTGSDQLITARNYYTWRNYTLFSNYVKDSLFMSMEERDASILKNTDLTPEQLDFIQNNAVKLYNYYIACEQQLHVDGLEEVTLIKNI